jgi:hypothetical protein
MIPSLHNKSQAHAGIKKPIVICLVLGALAVVAACLMLIPKYIRAKHSAALFCTWSSLKIASVDFEQGGKFTNHDPQYCRIYEFTNRYSVSGIVLQCILAADSWDYRERSNSLAITKNGVFLFIDKKGVIRVDNWRSLPGY